MYINVQAYDVPDENYVTEVMKAAPYLNFDDHQQIILDGFGFILVDTKDQIDLLYNQAVGDDGPTNLNSYDGKAKVYALTCNPDGRLMNENT